jgi:hypothetical protein
MFGGYSNACTPRCVPVRALDADAVAQRLDDALDESELFCCHGRGPPEWVLVEAALCGAAVSPDETGSTIRHGQIRNSTVRTDPDVGHRHAGQHHLRERRAMILVKAALPAGVI